MRGLLRFIALGIALLSGTRVCAEAGGPLESSRQELRKLGGTQGAKEGPSATEGVRPNLPVIHIPGEQTTPSHGLIDAEKLETERKRRKDARENWLVNGVEQLEKAEKAKESEIATEVRPMAGAAPQESSPKASDDPQYLLKLFDEQKKAEDSRLPEKTTQRTHGSDPLAPFLQGWLGNSPVRGQFFDEFVRKPEGTPAANPVMGPNKSANRDLAAMDIPSRSNAEKERTSNPYLPRDLPAQVELPTGTDAQRIPSPAVVPSPSTFERASIVPSTPLMETRGLDKKPPPPPLADDQKYFPQLKKF